MMPTIDRRRRSLLQRLWQWPLAAALLGHFPPALRPAQALQPPRQGSLVVNAHHPGATRPAAGLDNAQVDAAIARQLVEQAVQAWTGAPDLAAAWRQIIPDPSRKVAIKVNCQIQAIYTKATVVWPLVEGLRAAGVPDDHILIYDMTANAFTLAGFERNLGPGVKVGTVADFGGYARLLNLRLANLLTGGYPSEALNQLAAAGADRWLLARHPAPFDCSYLINVPVLKALDGYCGVTLSLKNHYGSIGNPGEHHEDIMEFIPRLNARPEIREKTRLVVLDALYGQYRWHNGRDQASVVPVNRILVSDDPVAIDALGWRLIEELRSEAGLGPVEPAPAYLAAAAAAGLGVADPQRIEQRHIDLGGEA